MTWRAVWEANLAYDLQSSNLDEATYRRFIDEVANHMRRTPLPAPEGNTACCGDDTYLAACEQIVGADRRYLLTGRPTTVEADAALTSVCTLRALREYHCSEEAFARGGSADDLLHWFRSDFSPRYLKQVVRGRKPCIWLTLAGAIDDIVRDEPPDDVATAVRDRLALGHDAHEHYVRFNVCAKSVVPPVRAPTTLDGGTHSLFAAAADQSGWGRTCDVPNNMFRLPEVVAGGIQTGENNGAVSVTYIGRVKSEPPRIDLAQRAQVLRSRMEQS
jgi:hypothetical protein